jgi:hypothetical protein
MKEDNRQVIMTVINRAKYVLQKKLQKDTKA